ncbi:hypothetical protein HDV05_000532 [Chytridiales sp. JEL 0842]|nr:hypothetical protein HDV05_000532 [Chytridiales sp. JEL 0842]
MTAMVAHRGSHVNQPPQQQHSPLTQITNFASLLAPKQLKAANTPPPHDQGRNSPVSDAAMNDDMRRTSSPALALDFTKAKFANSNSAASKRKGPNGMDTSSTSSSIQNNGSADMNGDSQGHPASQKRYRYAGLQGNPSQQSLGGTVGMSGTGGAMGGMVGGFDGTHNLTAQDYESWEDDEYLDQQNGGGGMNNGGGSQQLDDDDVELINDGDEDDKQNGQYQTVYDEKGNQVWSYAGQSQVSVDVCSHYNVTIWN